MRQAPLGAAVRGGGGAKGVEPAWPGCVIVCMAGLCCQASLGVGRARQGAARIVARTVHSGQGLARLIRATFPP